MEHWKAVFMKFIMCTGILGLVLGLFFGVSFPNIFILSVLLTVVSYIVGDVYLLPRFENWGATLFDFILAFVAIYLLGSFLFEMEIPLVTASLVSSAFLAVGEYFFHKYMANQVLDGHAIRSGEEKELINQKLQAEYSEELNQGIPEDREE
ncbi:YndM family protein [Virgibacillus halodenitrificans]|uniref:YndM family protein n=1 Tax=Virgibacillus halodenitrificans TaxID=1482 RepID=UPI000760EB61